MVRRSRLPKNVRKTTTRSVLLEAVDADAHAERLVERGRALQEAGRVD